MNNTLFNTLKLADFKSIVKQKYNTIFVKVDDFIVEDTMWHSLEDWEEKDDMEIVSHLEKLKEFEGKLWVITDASYKKEFGVFEVEATNLKRFIEIHEENFGERFVDTDLIIISFEQNIAWIFHHEGVYAIINLISS